MSEDRKKLNKETAKKIWKEGYREDPWYKNVGITIKQICYELAREGMYISPYTFRNLENRGLFKMNRTSADWRVTTRPGAEAIKQAIWINYTGMTREKFWEQREKFEKELEGRARYDERIIEDMIRKEAENEES